MRITGGDIIGLRRNNGDAMPNENPNNQFKILIVDDDLAVSKITRRILESAGYTVLEAHNGKTAAELMTQKPDLVLQDLILPDITGYDLVSKLRARAEDESLPVLALSGFMAQPDEPWDTSGGFDALLVKPVSREVLLETVKNYLTRRQASLER